MAELGIITNNPFSSSDWTIVGSNIYTFSVSIAINTSAGLTSNYIKLTNKYTNLVNEKQTITFTVNAVGGNVYFGWLGTSRSPVNYVFRFNTTSGVVSMYSTNAFNFTEFFTDNPIPISNGDEMSLVIELNKDGFTVTKSNVTQALNAYPLVYNSNMYGNSTAIFQRVCLPIIGGISCDINITAYKRESTDTTQRRVLVGDSIAQGYHAEDYGSTFGALCDMTINSAGSSTATDALTKLQQIIDLQPTKVFVELGINDVAEYGNPTWQSQYDTFITALLNAGLNVVCVSAIPGFSESPIVNAYLSSAYSSRYLDITTALQSTPNVLNPIYDAGDNHPNKAGNLVIANTIKASSLY